MIHDLKGELIKLRGKVSRQALSERADAVTGGGDLDPRRIQRHELEMATPPADGLRLRTHCAAVGLPWLAALALMDYWPPLAVGAPTIKRLLLRDWCERNGARVLREDADSGRVVVQL